MGSENSPIMGKKGTMIVMTKSSGLQYIVSCGFGSKGFERTYISAVMLQKVFCSCFLGPWARFWCVSLAIGALQLCVYHVVDNGLVRIANVAVNHWMW